jgi:branched-chain amino acid transport system permease protein
VLQFVIAGLVLGSIYALAASGLVITYVSAGVLNFAFGALAFFIARMYYWLHVQHNWGIIPAAGLSIFVVSPLLGVLLYVWIFRHLRLSSQLIKVVVTLGLSVLFPAIANLIFEDTQIYTVPGLAPQPVHVFHVFDTAVTLDNVITYGCLLLIVVAGALILRYTDAGLSVRAMVDSPAMTSLSGSNPSRVAAGVWAVSTFLAGLSGVLAAPVIGLDPGNFTLLIAAAFAAVIAARLRSLPIAVVAGLLMGIAGALVQYYLPPTSDITAAVIPSIPFAFIAIVLVYNIVRGGRVDEAEGVGGALDRAITPTGGNRLAAAAQVDNPMPRLTFAFPLILFAVVCILPLILRPFWVGLLGQAAALAIAMLSYTLVTGEGGMLWLCQITFAGVGALATAQLVTVHGWPFLPAVLVGGLIAAAIGIVIGLLTIRLGDLYVALVTLTVGLLMSSLVFTRPTFFHNGLGVTLARPGYMSSNKAFVYVALGVFAVLAILVVNLRRSTTGLAMSAVRYSTTGARTIGLSVLQMKLLIAALAAFCAGVGGGFLAAQSGVALPDSYAALAGVFWLVILVTQGIRSNIAALLAAMAFVFFPQLLSIYAPASWINFVPLGFGIGAVLIAKNPDGVLHQNAMQLQGVARRVMASRGAVGQPSPNGQRPAAEAATEPVEQAVTR